MSARRAIRVPGVLAPAIAAGHTPGLRIWPTDSTVSPSGIHGRTFDRLGEVIMKLVVRFGDDYDDANDWASAILQEIAKRRGGTDPRFLESPGMIVNYVRTTVSRRKQDRRKMGGHRQLLEADYGVTVDVPRYEQLMPETEFEESVLRTAVDRALAQVSDERREAFLSVRERGNTYREAATAMGLKERQVRYHVQATQDTIRAYLPKGVAV